MNSMTHVTRTAWLNRIFPASGGIVNENLWIDNFRPHGLKWEYSHQLRVSPQSELFLYNLFLHIKKNTLQRLKNKIYTEFSPVEVAEDELDILDLQIDALNAARSIDVDHAEAILRVELGSKVNSMSSKELRRDLLLFARNNPALFINLANDDNVQLRNFAVKAAEAKIISLSDDQRSFSWTSNGKKLMTVPFDENPYSAMAAFFKTDEGVEVFKSIEKKLKY